jgi:hypothetical protein
MTHKAKKTIWRAVGLITILSAIFTASVLTTGGSKAVAASNVTCYGDYCSGQDPKVTHCADDAVTFAAIADDKGSGLLDLRWSPTCKTEWARWQQYPTGWCVVCAPLMIRAVQDTGYAQVLEFQGDDHPTATAEAGGTYWTPMIYSPVHLVHAEVQMLCGDATITSAIMDCTLAGVEQTAAV